jgi:hypothetical protein
VFVFSGLCHWNSSVAEHLLSVSLTVAVVSLLRDECTPGHPWIPLAASLVYPSPINVSKCECKLTEEAEWAIMDDIFTQCREGNAVAVRLWLDNTENDLNQGWVTYQHLFVHKHFCVRCWIVRTRILIHLQSVSSLRIMHVGWSLWRAIRKPCFYWTHSSMLKYDITSKCWTAQSLFYSAIHKWCSCLVEAFDGFRYGQLILLHLFFANPLWCYDPWVVHTISSTQLKWGKLPGMYRYPPHHPMYNERTWMCIGLLVHQKLMGNIAG